MKWLGRTKEAAMRKKEERKKHDKLRNEPPAISAGHAPGIATFVYCL